MYAALHVQGALTGSFGRSSRQSRPGRCRNASKQCGAPLARACQFTVRRAQWQPASVCHCLYPAPAGTLDAMMLQPWGQRFNVVLLCISAVVIIMLLTAKAQLGGSIGSSLPFALGAWMYFMAASMSVEWLLLDAFWRLRQGTLPNEPRRYPALPWLRGRIFGRPWILYVLVGAVATVTVMREVAFDSGPLIALELNYSAYRDHVESSPLDFSEEKLDAPKVQLRGRAISCRARCAPAGAVCDTILTRLGCDEANGRHVERISDTWVLIDLVHGGDPFCYTPLLKSARWHLSGDLHLTSVEQGGAAHHSILFELNAEQRHRGFGSCYEFRAKLGQEAAQRLIDNLGQYISSH